jgi:hypothetical protein
VLYKFSGMPSVSVVVTTFPVYLLFLLYNRNKVSSSAPLGGCKHVANVSVV